VRPLGIHHVAVNVSDLEEALEFYEGALGLTRRDDRPDFGIPGAWLDAGSAQLHLLVATPARSVGQHFAILVEDLDATVAALRDRGLAPSDPALLGRDRMSFVNDPSGNAVELHELG